MQAISLHRNLPHTTCEFCRSHNHTVFTASGYHDSSMRPHSVKICVHCARSLYQQVTSLTNANQAGKVPQ